MSDVMIGAADWQLKEWLTSYYPEDLPAEWRLSYYANEFMTTFLDCQQWSHPEQQAVLEEMLADCHAGFHPVLSVKVENITPQQVDGFFQWLAGLDEEVGIQRVAGVMLSAEGKPVEKSALRLWRENIPPQLPIALHDYSGFDDINGKWLADHQMSPVWSADLRTDIGYEYWLCEVSIVGDMRAMATQVETCLSAVSDDRPVCVIAGSGHEDIDRLRQLLTIVGLIRG